MLTHAENEHFIREHIYTLPSIFTHGSLALIRDLARPFQCPGRKSGRLLCGAADSCAASASDRADRSVLEQAPPCCRCRAPEGHGPGSRPVVSSVESAGGKDEDPKDQRQCCGGRGVMADENQPPALTSMRAMYRWVKGIQGHCWLREQVVLPNRAIRSRRSRL